MQYNHRILRLFALLLILCLLITGIPVSGKAATVQSSSQGKNLFEGMFDNYKHNPEYAGILRKKYPDDTERYSDDCFIPYVSEMLTLYLDELDKAGFDFGVIERNDKCSETSYVVELTENGQSVIQISFTTVEYDPKAARIMTLGCSTDGFNDLDTLNARLKAMWIAYDTMNIHMTPEKHSSMILNSETSHTEEFGTMMRGQYDGLAYLQTISENAAYLLITPDFTVPLFEGMPTHHLYTEPTKDLTVGDHFYFGSFEQDNDPSNGAEPIRWVVLDREDDEVLAVSASGLDSRRFHNAAGKISWKNSSIRTWLNNDFYYKAFDAEEKARIKAQRVEILTPKDNVFLLSREEAEGYFPTDAERICVATPYAVARNAYVNENTGGSWWLLRTSGTESGCVMSVNSDGTVDYDGGNVQSDKGIVRPAIRISIED